MFVSVLHQSLLRDLFTTPGVYRKLNVGATTKQTFHVLSREILLMTERSLGNKPDDQLSHCILTDNGHKHKLMN